MSDAGQAASREQRYAEAAAAFGPALERLARAYERDPDRRRDLLQEIHIGLSFVPGVALALLGRGLADRPTSHTIALVVCGVVLFLGVAWWNAHAARKLQREIHALDAS